MGLPDSPLSRCPYVDVTNGNTEPAPQHEGVKEGSGSSGVAGEGTRTLKPAPNRCSQPFHVGFRHFGVTSTHGAQVTMTKCLPNTTKTRSRQLALPLSVNLTTF